MTDVFSQEKRSEVMSRIKSKDTIPEKKVRSMLHKMGYTFRLHRKDLPGTPDIVLPRYKVAIFVHGCFWHRHKGCKFAYQPKSRANFWQTKLECNVERDRRTEEELIELGWQIVIIWECELANDCRLKKRIAALLEPLRNA
jgi:DNA mismatch endonuclease, patch repair protein